MRSKAGGVVEAVEVLGSTPSAFTFYTSFSEGENSLEGADQEERDSSTCRPNKSRVWNLALPANASLAYAFCYTLIWLIVFWNSIAAKIFIKI